MPNELTDNHDHEARMSKARQEGEELARAYREEKITNAVPNRVLKRYCAIASMESLREMADEFAIAHEDAELEIVCDAIELKIYEDQQITKAWVEKHVPPKE